MTDTIASLEPCRARSITYSTAYRRTTDLQHSGGDLFEICCAKNGVVRVLLADVSSKGTRSFEHVALLRAEFLRATFDANSPANILHRLNGVRLTTPDESSTTFATAFVAMIVPGDDLVYASAGHEPALLFRRSHHDHLAPTGPVLNVFDDAMYAERHVMFGATDRLAIATDGVFECCAAGNHSRQFGSSGVAKVLSTESRAESVLRATDAFCRRVYRDDATIAVISRTHEYVSDGTTPSHTSDGSRSRKDVV